MVHNCILRLNLRTWTRFVQQNIIYIVLIKNDDSIVLLLKIQIKRTDVSRKLVKIRISLYNKSNCQVMAFDSSELCLILKNFVLISFTCQTIIKLYVLFPNSNNCNGVKKIIWKPANCMKRNVQWWPFIDYQQQKSQIKRCTLSFNRSREETFKEIQKLTYTTYNFKVNLLKMFKWRINELKYEKARLQTQFRFNAIQKKALYSFSIFVKLVQS